MRREAFFTCWTRKEAFFKAKEIGLNDSLKHVDVRGPGFSQKPFLIDDPFSSEMVWP
ncbi:4'-phosphopantetheinyl transferase superfamily protein [Nitrospira sp. M1]